MGERLQKTPSTKGLELRVERVRVTGLFGLYDHDIPLKLEDRVTIIHGPNGVGKTVLLKLIAAIFNGQFEELTKVPFKRLELDFRSGQKLSIEFEKTLPRFPDFDDEVYAVFYLSLSHLGRENRVAFRQNESLEYELDGTPYLAKSITWSRTQTKRPLTDKVDLGAERPITPDDAINGSMHEPKWFVEYRNRMEVHLIETQRLLRMQTPYGGALVPTVRQYAQDLHRRINEALAEYATESQSLDQSFPQRLLKKTGKQSGLPIADLKARMAALNDKRAHLQSIGLLEQATSTPFELESLDSLDHAQSSVMTLYVEDTERKLAVLDDISRRITLLLNNVNGKFQNKSLQISRESGFVVLGHDRQPIEPDSLSSGEQHELVQLYDLLFRVKPGTLVLIDEPELSLHVLWQKRYLTELIEIAKTAEFDAIIATHSPFIVGDRSDLMVPLAADIDS